MRNYSEQVVLGVDVELLDLKFSLLMFLSPCRHIAFYIQKKLYFLLISLVIWFRRTNEDSNYWQLA